MILNQFGKLENRGRNAAEYITWRELMKATVTSTTAEPADSASNSMAASCDAPARTIGDENQAAS